MTPWQLAASKSEHSEQRALFAWANCVANYGFHAASFPAAYVKEDREAMFAYWGFHPEPVSYMNLMFAIHNQGHGDKIRGAQAKAEGVKKGIPDIFLPVPSIRKHGLFIELKRGKGGVVSEEQRKTAAALEFLDYNVLLGVKGWRQAAIGICNYLGVSTYPNEQ